MRRYRNRVCDIIIKNNGIIREVSFFRIHDPLFRKWRPSEGPKVASGSSKAISLQYCVGSI